MTYDSRTAWKERSFATSWTTGYLATDTKPQVRPVVVGQGRSFRPKGWWGPPTHPHHGCTVVAGFGHDEPARPEPVQLEANDGASRGKRRPERVQTISEMTGVKSTLTAEQSARLRAW